MILYISFSAVFKHLFQVLEYKLFVSTKTGLEERKAEFGKTSLLEFFVLLKNNRVETVWDSPREHSFWRNFKRSVASLLQVSGKEGEEKLVINKAFICNKFFGNCLITILLMGLARLAFDVKCI